MKELEKNLEATGGVPAEAELAAINRFAKSPLRAEEVYTFSLRLCDNEVDRDWERFDTAALNTLGDLFVGKSGIFDHQWTAEGQTARIYRTEMVREGAQVTAVGDGYCWLKAWAYLLRTEKNADLIAEIEGGIKREVSVGCSVARRVCSICGAEGGTCQHTPGQRYGEQLCYLELRDPTDAYEWSFVAVPAQRKAGVLKRYGHENQGMAQLRAQAELGRKYLNSILVLVVTLAIVIPVVCCAAYAIARTNFRFKKGIYFYLLLGVCIPTGVLAIPIFSVALKFGLVNTYWGMILFGAAQCMAFGTFLLRSFFISLPRGLEEAAMIDGCTRFQSFIHVILPLAKPGIMTLVIYDGITIWNEYLLANVLLRDAEKMTLPLGMKAFMDKYVTDYPQLFAALVIVTIPMLIIYFFAQKSFIEGMTAGSVKQ